MKHLLAASVLFAGVIMVHNCTHADDFSWRLRSQAPDSATGEFRRVTRDDAWPAKTTAFIVCDVWDKHHCLNAVRRLEEFAPRLNAVLTEARRRGAVIIHSPSDCMPAYTDHPARIRAVSVPFAAGQPVGVADWCSRIPSEEQAAYPVDQSDGGEDDDPQEHAEWAAELTALGRNPNMPWKTQSPLIVIDPDRDYISDTGDEVWNILKHHGVEHVVLTGVHTNMCVLGRPFGLRQMVRNGFETVLMRDMTDCMYNPQRWPFVDHFTGNDLVISHVERFVCPTVTSDRVLGGEPFQFANDRRSRRDVMEVDVPKLTEAALKMHWCTVRVPATWDAATAGQVKSVTGSVWHRAAVVLAPDERDPGQQLRVSVVLPNEGSADAWVNGEPLTRLPTGGDGQSATFALPQQPFATGDAALLVIRTESPAADIQILHAAVAPRLTIDGDPRSLAGRWQVRIGDDPSWSNMPLPAKFGAATDIVFQP